MNGQNFNEMLHDEQVFAEFMVPNAHTTPNLWRIQQQNQENQIPQNFQHLDFQYQTEQVHGAHCVGAVGSSWNEQIAVKKPSSSRSRKGGKNKEEARERNHEKNKALLEMLNRVDPAVIDAEIEEQKEKQRLRKNRGRYDPIGAHGAQQGTQGVQNEVQYHRNFQNNNNNF